MHSAMLVDYVRQVRSVAESHYALELAAKASTGLPAVQKVSNIIADVLHQYNPVVVNQFKTNPRIQDEIFNEKWYVICLLHLQNKIQSIK